MAVYGLLLALVLVGTAYATPVPDPASLDWTRREIGAFFSFNMITFTTKVYSFCLPHKEVTTLPSIDTFNPDKLDMDNWLEAAVAMGAKYAVLTVKHCSGFCLWPTDIYDETGFEYQYSTKYASFKEGNYDMLRDFVESCKRHNISPGLYYSLNENLYLNAGHGLVETDALMPGQVLVSQDLYAKIVVAQLKEILTNYGSISELWFDGGCAVPGIQDNIVEILAKYQPGLSVFNCDGCSNSSRIRWIGTESGTPGYPIWSNSDSCSPGLGNIYGDTFCPAEVDTTLQENDLWFWRPDTTIRSLSTLQSIYYHSVGQNTNLLLNAAANSSGLIEDSYMQRYKEFGDWINKCFKNNPVNSTSGKGSIFTMNSTTPMKFNQVVISEDESGGESITNFIISALLTNGTSISLIDYGKSVGNKFIRAVPTITAHRVQLVITGYVVEPSLLHFGLYYC